MTLDVQFSSFRPMLGFGTTQIRCQQPAAFLAAMGWKVRTGMVLSAAATRCRVLVLHRVRYDPLVAKIIALAKSRGTYVIFDIDDLVSETKDGNVFAPDIVKTMRLCDMVTVSGSFLAEKVASVHENCRIMRNKLASTVLDSGAAAIAGRGSPGQTVTLGYFSGSAHHDADFAQIAPEIIKLLHSNANVRLTVGGKINVGEAFDGFGERFRFEPFRPYREFIGLLGGIDINLAPLDLASPFAQARSELKFLEAAAFGVPTVASPTPAYAEAITHGQTGHLAKAGVWFDTLTELVSDVPRRWAMGAAARTFVENAYGPTSGQKEWDALLNACVARNPTTPSRPGISDIARSFSIEGQARFRSSRQMLRSLLK
jgi:hypothetical protein